MNQNNHRSSYLCDYIDYCNYDDNIQSIIYTKPIVTNDRCVLDYLLDYNYVITYDCHNKYVKHKLYKLLDIHPFFI